MRVHPVILSGGSGTRLWPLSRAQHPKQLLSLAGDGTMLQQTLRRVADPACFERPIVIANNDHRFIVAEQLREAGIAPRAILLEPVGRNTAPAAAVAALLLTREMPDAVMAILPSDHLVRDEAAFRAAMDVAVAAARAGHLVTFGIAPDRPETGYGYIRRGVVLDGLQGACAVDAFIEKPDRARAEAYLAEGGYAWNSGMFVVPAAGFLAELERLQPAMLEACRAALAGAAADLDFLRLAAEALARAPSLSIDYAVMEHTALAAVVPAAFGWSDVGAWNALWDIADKDAAGNVVQGPVMLADVRDSYLRSEDGRLVAAVGLVDTVVVATSDAVLIAPRDRAEEVKALVERLKAEGRPEADWHPRVYRPWGSYREVDAGDRFKVKRIVVKPGGQLSLQRHARRAEHWVVVRGSARVTRGTAVVDLGPDQSIYIPLGEVHRLENPGTEPVHLIEVQTGDYLGEDDIERIEDRYGRD